jgi:hypothetical protein
LSDEDVGGLYLTLCPRRFRISFSIIGEVAPKNPQIHAKFNWVVDLYSYATEYTPIPNSDFKSHGGVVYTLTKHGGNLDLTGKDLKPIDYTWYENYGVVPTEGTLTNYLETPEKWTKKTDNTYECMDFYLLFLLHPYILIDT